LQLSKYLFMEIRKANSKDAAAIAPLLLLAMEEIFYDFIGNNSYEIATSFLTELIQQKENQYSYQNCWVVEFENKITGVACVYDGADLSALQNPIAKMIKSTFNHDFNPEKETQAGEIYIDCVGINSNFQGRGIGSKLFQFLVDEYVKNQQKNLGLLVDLENPKAQKLYERLGFEVMGEKQLTGRTFNHMQIKA